MARMAYGGHHKEGITKLLTLVPGTLDRAFGCFYVVPINKKYQVSTVGILGVLGRRRSPFSPNIFSAPGMETSGSW